jgi:hypothetical protein
MFDLSLPVGINFIEVATYLSIQMVTRIDIVEQQAKLKNKLEKQIVMSTGYCLC